MKVPIAPQGPHTDALEILSVALLDEERPTVTELKALAGELKIGLGWHYLMDLAWIVRRLGTEPATVLDAGAGTGILQWYLADRGWRVISVDRMSRSSLPARFRSRYRVRGLRPADLEPAGPRSREHRRRLIRLVRRLPHVITALRHGYRPRLSRPRPGSVLTQRIGSGEVIIYNEDLRSLGEIADASIDEVVSISSLEHNTPEDLVTVISELLRVLKPGGRLLATLGASGGDDWYHESSQGWCYSESTLRRVFQLQAPAASNFARFDELLDALRANSELKDNLSAFYFRSGANGMPWGTWDPKYLSVGIRKIKPMHHQV